MSVTVILPQKSSLVGSVQADAGLIINKAIGSAWREQQEAVALAAMVADWSFTEAAVKEAKAATKGLTASEVASESKITLDGYKSDVQHNPAQRIRCAILHCTLLGRGVVSANAGLQLSRSGNTQQWSGITAPANCCPRCSSLGRTPGQRPKVCKKRSPALAALAHY